MKYEKQIEAYKEAMQPNIDKHRDLNTQAENNFNTVGAFVNAGELPPEDSSTTYLSSDERIKTYIREYDPISNRKISELKSEIPTNELDKFEIEMQNFAIKHRGLLVNEIDKGNA